MLGTVGGLERRTTTDAVFNTLHDDIVSLKLLPGTKLSEAEVARRIGVSRQPVRDAFNRLANMDLLCIRPQRATVVRGFSMERIAHARFVRLALELEIVRRACAVWNDEHAKALARNLDEQRIAIAAEQSDRFHAADEQFHELICNRAGYPLAAETIRDQKVIVDRLCVLSLKRESEAETLLNDHVALAESLRRRSADDAMAVVRIHLARLDKTIEEMQKSHAEYFE